MAIKAITTGEATVKTLTISGQQVTLSIFQQLFEETLVEPHTAKLLGVPWVSSITFGATAGRAICMSSGRRAKSCGALASIRTLTSLKACAEPSDYYRSGLSTRRFSLST